MSANTIEIPVKPARQFLPEQLSFASWEELEPYYRNLGDREIKSVADLEKWLRDWSELEAVFSEELGWRYIRTTCHTTDDAINDAYDFFVAKLEPENSAWVNRFQRKLIESPFLAELDHEKYRIMIRGIRREIEIFREENIPIFTEIERERNEYGKIDSEMSVEMEGKEITLQRAANYLRHPDANLRREAFEKSWKRREQDAQKLNELFDRLCTMRHRVAVNAGFSNYRDYCFASFGRFDYTKEDCFDFHQAVAKHILPLVTQLDEQRKKTFGGKLHPWDLDADPQGRPALHPFDAAGEMVEKTIHCLQKVNPDFADFISIMKEMKHFDLDSRKGKAPGGYNYPLNETGVPFIFMNSVGSQRDLVTMVHEAGHAIHSFLSRNLELNAFKNPPSEIAELASMSMELISMEHWNAFYENADDLKRARKEQLEKILRTLIWVAIVDRFQHWVYENHDHTPEERRAAWLKVVDELDSKVPDWSGCESFQDLRWQRQLHIFEVPFYYIEYGFAQLGAVAVWRNYKRNPQETIKQYEKALSLGYMKSIGEVYEAAGIRFDFSSEYVSELADFIRTELASLE